MGRIVYTANNPFPMQDWNQRHDFCRVFGGHRMIMALTENGTVLKKSFYKPMDLSGSCTHSDWETRALFDIQHSVKFRNFYSLSPEVGWADIRQISISKVFEGVAIGLRNDGQCAAFVEPTTVQNRRAMYAAIQVYDWEDIVEVSVSDAFFALDRFGRVHHASIFPDDYFAVNSWRDIVHIVTGAQNSVFGITKDGKVLCAGSNCCGRFSHLDKQLEPYHNILDLYAAGSECEVVYLLSKDGTVAYTRGNTQAENINGECIQKLDGHFYYTVFGQTSSNRLLSFSSRMNKENDKESEGWNNVRSFSFGAAEYIRPFLIAVIE